MDLNVLARTAIAPVLLAEVLPDGCQNGLIRTFLLAGEVVLALVLGLTSESCVSCMICNLPSQPAHRLVETDLAAKPVKLRTSLKCCQHLTPMHKAHGPVG